MSDTVKAGGSGVSFASLLGLLFIGLKLGGVMPVAGWSWWWVTCPLWIGLALTLFFLLMMLVVAIIAAVLKAL